MTATNSKLVDQAAIYTNIFSDKDEEKDTLIRLVQNLQGVVKNPKNIMSSIKGIIHKEGGSPNFKAKERKYTTSA